MGFTRDSIRAAADKNFQGLELDDAPNGAITLRSMLRCSTEEQKAIRKNSKDLKELEQDEEASETDVAALVVGILGHTAGSARAGDLEAYLEDFDLAELMTLFLEWSEKTQAPKAQK